MNIDIKHLAKLSRLKFSPEEEAKFSGEMEKIVEMVEKPESGRQRHFDRPQ